MTLLWPGQKWALRLKQRHRGTKSTQANIFKRDNADHSVNARCSRRYFFLWQNFSVSDPVFANKTCQLCQLCQLCHLQLKGLSPVCLRLCRVSSSERANLAKKRTRSVTIINLDDNHSKRDDVLNPNIELNCSNLAMPDSQKPTWC